MQSYSIYLDGIGSYNLDGYCYTGGDDTYWDYDENGNLILKYHSKKMYKEKLYVKDGQIIFCPTLVFE